MQLLMWGFCCCSSLNTVKYLKVMQWVAIDSDQRWVISWWLQSVLWMETEMENSIKMTLSEQCQVMQPQGELFFCGVFPTSDHLVLPTALDGASLVAQRLKYLPAMQETWVRFLGWEDVFTKQRHHFVAKSPYSQGYDLSRSHVWRWELNNKVNRVP